jgi:pimeloyl-ACP methyl ester carboxylesterase
MGMTRVSNLKAWAALLVVGLLVTLVVLALSACGGAGGGGGGGGDGEAAGADQKLDRVVELEGGRGLYVRCTGSGSPTVVMEAGDEGDHYQYAYAQKPVAKKTRTCVYDRAGIGQSDPAPPAPRQLPDLVGDLEKLLDSAEIPGPYVLVGSSGGGYIIAGYAEEHPDRVAGMVLVETPAPWLIADPPPEVVKYTDPDNPENIEHRDFLQVEKDAWQARRRIGDIPMRVISADYPDEFINEEPNLEARKELRHNVELQKGWLDASPQAKQIVVHTGHVVEEEEPDVVIDAILEVVREARAKPS